MGNTPEWDETYEKDWDEAHLTNTYVRARKSNYDKILAIFEGEAECDHALVIESLQDLNLRDALLVWLSNTYNISLYGDETSLRDNHEKRLVFGSFVYHCAEEYGWTPHAFGFLTAVQLLDGAWQEAQASAEATIEEVGLDTPYLSQLIAFATNTYGERAVEKFEATMADSGSPRRLLNRYEGAGV